MLILDDLWYGNVQPSDRAVLHGSEYEKLSRKTAAISDQIRAALTEEQEKLLDDLLDTEMIMASISEQDAFSVGVRIGAKFILDVLGEYASQLPQITAE